MTKHQFVQITTLPVTAEVNGEGGIDLHVASDQSEQIATEDAKVGCWFCGAPIDTETVDEECPEAPIDLPRG